jgi:predicted dehydrogenase
MRWMLGEPEQVFGWQTLSQSGVDEAFSGLLHYENGALGVFDCGFRQQFRVQAEVVGESGALTIERPYPINSESRIILQRDQEQEIINVPQADAYRCQVDALTAAALDGADLPVPLGSSRANVATLAALYQSARENAPITLTAPRNT